MFTGRSEELRQAEAEAGRLADQVATLLDQIDALGAGQTTGRIDGPGFQLWHDGRSWICSS
ncbi:MAG: hypothetical protein HOZ81_13460 [Streptomyces sp.]|nr:hypothetical protein [Streptomyces sp.]